MKFCTDHWAALRKALDDRGMSALIAETGEQAAKNLADELQDGRTIDNYDPLMAAHNAIVSNCLSQLGIGLLMEQPDGSNPCPLCAMNESSRESWRKAQETGICPCGCKRPPPETPSNYDKWIDVAADEQVEVWKAMKP